MLNIQKNIKSPGGKTMNYTEKNRCAFVKYTMLHNVCKWYQNWSIIKKVLALYNIWNIRIAPLQTQKSDTIYGCILIIIVQTYR